MSTNSNSIESYSDVLKVSSSESIDTKSNFTSNNNSKSNSQYKDTSASINRTNSINSIGSNAFSDAYSIISLEKELYFFRIYLNKVHLILQLLSQLQKLIIIIIRM